MLFSKAPFSYRCCIDSRHWPTLLNSLCIKCTSHSYIFYVHVGERYRFDRSGMISDTSVSTMKPHCRKYNGHKNCTLVSEISNELLPVVYNISHYDLGKCEINGIYILHDCKLRHLSLGLPILKLHEDQKYYIHVSIWVWYIRLCIVSNLQLCWGFSSEFMADSECHCIMNHNSGS